MYVVNPEILNQDNLYFCENKEIVDYLIDNGFIYLSKKYDAENQEIIWIFSKTDDLIETLQEWGVKYGKT